MPHSIGHYLGADLHDCPSVGVTTLLQPGTVITIEPGLYLGNAPSIPAWYPLIFFHMYAHFYFIFDNCSIAVIAMLGFG